MLELLNSLVRLSAAVTVYGMQEVQTAAGIVKPTESVDKLREMIDSLANSVSAKIDESRRPTLETFSNMGMNVMDRTVGRTIETLNSTLNVPSMLPKDILQSTSDAVKSTSEWLGRMVKPEPTIVEATYVEEVVILT